VTAVALAILIAVTTARRGKLVRTAASTAELLVIAMPTFVIGLALLLAFAVYIPLFPVANAPGWRGLVLPTLSLALPLAAMLAQVLRQELEDVLEQPFILTARSRGLSDIATRLRHALRHAVTPIITLSGFVLAALLGGAAVTEALFARPGIGRLMVEATNATDVPVVVGVTLFGALVYVLANIIVDIVGALIDPRTATA
jgi:peptide/nickel transport system permease protein